MSVATDILKPAVSLVFLVELTAGFWARAWVLSSGKTVTYEVSTLLDSFCTEQPLEFTEVKCNGTPLTSRASSALVEANPGSYYHTGSVLYVSAPTGTPFAKTVIATCKFYFASKPKIFNDIFYDPRVKSVPALSLRIEEEFAGVGQVGGGNLVLLNGDKLFDARDEFLWDYGRATIKFGTDTPQTTMAYADYQTIGTWLVEYWTTGYGDFTLKLKELKSRLLKMVPVDFYTRANYAQADDGIFGKVIPRAYGTIFGAKPALINTSTNRFKVAGHAIWDLSSVRIKIGGVWTSSTFASTDLSLAEFTLGSDWESGREVAVDFIGRTNADGSQMVNAADIVTDLLAVIGETDLNTSAFTAAEARLDVGLTNDGLRNTLRRVSLYLDSQKNVLAVLGEINSLIGSYLFCNASGQWTYGVFEPTRGEALTVFDEIDFTTFEPLTDISEVPSEIVGKYAERRADGWSEVESLEATENQYLHGQPSAVPLAKTLAFIKRADVLYWLQRELLMARSGLKTYRMTLCWQAMLKLPGDQVRVTDSRTGFDEVLEILHFSSDLLEGRVTLLLGNLRAFARTTGFWVADADVLPNRFAGETGYGAGSVVWNASWSTTIKNWAKQNVGYWTDANGFASTSDPDSFIASTWF